VADDLTAAVMVLHQAAAEGHLLAAELTAVCAALEQAQGDVEHWHAHYDAAQAMEDQALRENARLRLVLDSQDRRLDEKHALARTLARALADAEALLESGPVQCAFSMAFVHGQSATAEHSAWAEAIKQRRKAALALPAVQALLKAK